MPTLADPIAADSVVCPAEILRCPLTHGRLRALSPSELAALNERTSRGELLHVDGSPVQEPLEAGYVSLDGTLAYGVREGIALLLPALAMALVPSAIQNDHLRGEKRAVQKFYDEIGWSAGDSGEAFVDAENWEDLRPVARRYVHQCHLRVKRHLRPSGKYLLDAASGPVQYPEYVTYSADYSQRICVDISFAALQQARRKLGSHGLYVLGDITNLPLADGVVDGAVSLHTIYHTPADEQATAFREIFRVLRPGSSAAVVYCWRSLLIKAAMLPAKLLAAPLQLLGRHRAQPTDRSSRTRLYYHAHPPAWFSRQLGDLPAEIHVWRSITVPMQQAYIHPWLLGRALLGLIYRAEELFPRFLGRYTAYPLIVLNKPEDQARCTAA